MMSESSSQNRSYISVVDSYLKGKQLRDYRALAYTRDLWVKYNVVEASLQKDAELLKYWEEMGYKLPEDLAAAETQSLEKKDAFCLFSINEYNKQIVSAYLASISSLGKSEILSMSQRINYGNCLGLGNLTIDAAQKLGIIIVLAMNQQQLGLVSYPLSSRANLNLDQMLFSNISGSLSLI